MYNILFSLTAPTNDLEIIQANFPILFQQPKQNNNIFSELLLLFKESQDEHILEQKLTDLGVTVFLLDTLF